MPRSNSVGESEYRPDARRRDGAASSRPVGRHASTGTSKGRPSVQNRSGGRHAASSAEQGGRPSHDAVARPSRRRTAQGAADGARTSQPTRAARASHADQTPEIPQKQKSRNVPALDGIRCLAVLGVIFYHMNFAFAQGGLLGVTVFFVLSGYLITNLLLIELDNTKKINLPHFWFRRIRRLLPAILFALAGTAVLCTLFSHVMLTKMRGDLLPSLFFFNNWWQIFHEVSYFDALGSPSPITHYWSLAIEEQFYLIWPPVLLLVSKLGAKRAHIRNGVLVAAVVSALLMGIMYDPATDPSRVYYGTDTRAFSLLIGAALAFIRPTRSNDELSQGESRLPRAAIEAIGFVALAALILMMALCNGFSDFIYRGGLVLCSLLTAVVIYASVHPNTIFTRILGWRGFVFVGKLSYSMYLWHFPVLLVFDPTRSSTPTWYMCILEVAIIVLLSWVSFKFVEDPIRHGALGRVFASVKNKETTWPNVVRSHVFTIVPLAIVAVVAVGGLALVPDTQAMSNADALKQQSEQNEAKRAELQEQAQQAQEGQAEGAVDEETYDMLAIGDSVMATAQIYESDAFPNQMIDAAVNRRLADGIEVYKEYEAMHVVGDVVVFSLGTNGYLDEDGLEELLAECGSSRHVFFVNCRSPNANADANNETLAEFAAKHDNVQIIDWYSASNGNEDYFDGDGTHPGPEGAALYMSLIRNAIAPYMPADAYDVPAETTAAEASSN